MKSPQVFLALLGPFLLASGCGPAVAQHDLSSASVSAGQQATLEYLAYWTPIDIVEIDGRPVTTKRLESGRGVNNVFGLDPGPHTVRFRGNAGSPPLRPDVISFEAGPGKRYSASFDIGNQRLSEGESTALHFNDCWPVVAELRDGKPVPVAVGARDPFETRFDAQKNLLLFEDVSLPKERTARVYFPRFGVLNQQAVFLSGLSGRAGTTLVQFRRSSPDSRQYRLLPGEYLLTLTMEGGAWRVGDVQSGERTVTATLEAGHTYRINSNAVGGDTKVDSRAGTMTMQQSFSWNPSIEDVTGRVPADE